MPRSASAVSKASRRAEYVLHALPSVAWTERLASAGAGARAERRRERLWEHAYVVDGDGHRNHRLGADARVVLVEPWVLDGDLVARAAAGAQRAVDAGDGAAQDDEVRAVDSVGLEVGTHPRGEVGVEMRSTVAIALRPDAGEDLLQVGQEGGIGIGDLQVERAGRGRSVGELELGRAGQDAGAAAAVAGHDALGAKRLVSGGGGPG